MNIDHHDPNPEPGPEPLVHTEEQVLDSKEPEHNPAPAEENDPSEKQDLSDASVGAGMREHLKNMADASGALLDGAAGVVEESALYVGRQVKRGVTAAADAVGGRVARHLDEIGTPPGEDSKIKEEIRRAIPVIGARQTYADGWKAWHAGKSADPIDEDLIQDGRVKCITALGEAGFDIGTLGLASKLRAHRAIGRLVTGLGVTRLARFQGVSLDALGYASKLVAKSKAAQDVADWLLSTVKPRAAEAQSPTEPEVPDTQEDEPER